MTVIKLNGERHECPSCMEELTVRHYIRILKEWDIDKDVADRDYFKLLNILTDGKFAGYEKTTENDITIFDLVGWVITQSFMFSSKLPKVLEYKSRLIPIPEDISELSIGQNIHLRREIEKTKTIEENISIAAAIFLQPLIEERKFDFKRAQDIAKEIDNMPVYLIHPIGFFLLTRHLKFGLPSGKIWSRIKINLKQMLRKMLPFSPKSKGLHRTTI